MADLSGPAGPIGPNDNPSGGTSGPAGPAPGNFNPGPPAPPDTPPPNPNVVPTTNVPLPPGYTPPVQPGPMPPPSPTPIAPPAPAASGPTLNTGAAGNAPAAGTASAAPVASTPPPAPAGITQDAYNLAINMYPQYAWMLNVPELADLIKQLAQDGTPAPQALARFQATNWWRERSDAQRAWIELAVTNSGEARQRVDAQKAAASATLSRAFGAQLSDAQLTATAYASLMNGWTDQQLKDHLASAVTVGSDGSLTLRPYSMDPKTGLEMDVLTGRRAYYGPNGEPATPDEATAKAQFGDDYKSFVQQDGTTVYYGTKMGTALDGSSVATTRSGTASGGGDYGAQLAALRKIAADYLIPVSDQMLGQRAIDILAGRSDVNAFTADMQTQASQLWGPEIAQRIKQGATMSQIVDPYRQSAARLLGVNPDSIDFTEPKWQKALANQDATSGQTSVMTLPQWQRTLMTDPTYGYSRSQNGLDRAAAMVNALGATFGKSTGGSGYGGTAPQAA